MYHVQVANFITAQQLGLDNYSSGATIFNVDACKCDSGAVMTEVAVINWRRKGDIPDGICKEKLQGNN